MLFDEPYVIVDVEATGGDLLRDRMTEIAIIEMQGAVELDRWSTLLNPQQTIPLKMAPMVYIGTILTHLFGGSAGREGTAVQMSTAIADQFTGIFKLSQQERKVILISAISAGFASVFGTPITGAVFAIEVLYFSSVSFKSIIPSFLTAYIAYFTVEFFQIPHTHYQHPYIPELHLELLPWLLLVGILFGLTARIFSTSVHYFSEIAKEFISLHNMIELIDNGQIYVIPK